jgi:hypothetical protein
MDWFWPMKAKWVAGSMGLENGGKRRSPSHQDVEPRLRLRLCPKLRDAPRELVPVHGDFLRGRGLCLAR